MNRKWNRDFNTILTDFKNTKPLVKRIQPVIENCKDIAFNNGEEIKTNHVVDSITLEKFGEEMTKRFERKKLFCYYTNTLERIDTGAMSPSVVIIREVHRKTKTSNIIYRLNGLYAFLPMWEYRHFFYDGIEQEKL